jgi:hypothetical protein
MSTMRRFVASHKGGVLAATAGALILGWMNIAVATQSPAAARPGAPGFLQAGHCYRFTFSIEGTPEWKVLEVLDDGWIRAEVDVGPSSAQRQPAWVNTAQLVTAREMRCSD